MTVLYQVLVEVLHVVERGLEARQQTTASPSPTTVANPTALTTTSVSQSVTPSSMVNNSGPTTSSPLLFFVALGFGVVFTNLWIIVGVKYCFRYNARNRAIRNGEDIDVLNLENMPTRPHRRRREKKLMTMDEVNERFPLTKYKNWVASRAREGLPTSGGVTAPTSRAGSLRDADGVMPSSPVGTKHSVYTRPPTAASDVAANDITISPATNHLGGTFGSDSAEKDGHAEEVSNLQHVRTTTSTVDEHANTISEEDDDDDDHIHTAVPPELLTNPGDSCAICIDTLEDDDDIRGLTCGHAFHAGCLDPWLTSRRACCPLCKADYYIPKPRPEGEPVEPERSGRRRNPAMNLAEAPRSAWVGNIRGTRLILPGRFIAAPVYGGDAFAGYDRRRARRARRDGSVGAQALDRAGNGAAPQTSRWRPGNPFSSLSMPSMRLPGRNRNATASSEPTPSVLEEGVVR